MKKNNSAELLKRMVYNRKLLPLCDISQEDFDNFWKTIIFYDDCDCWNTTYVKDPKGYASLRAGIDRTKFRCHYFSWRVFNPEAEDDVDKIICHSCDNRWCVNPKHLRLDTPKSNNIDRAVRNNNDPSKKLSIEDVIEIKRLLSTTRLTLREIGEKFGVSLNTISEIKQGRNWGHL